MGKSALKNKMALREHLIFWLTKSTYVFIYIILPIIMVGWLEALAGFILAAVVCGFTISVVFQTGTCCGGDSISGTGCGEQ
jgi:linoleoyl-CoA desaturase